MNRLLLCMMALGSIACPTSARAADSAAKPQLPAADAFDSRVWELTSYLKGTAPEIRDRLNGESERLAGKVAETQKSLRETRNDSKNDERACLDKLRKTATYQAADAEVKKAEADLETARKSGSSTDRMEASSRYNKHRQTIQKMEKDALAHFQPVIEDNQRIAELERDLKRYKESLDKATKWRAQLLTAIRNSYCLKAPVNLESRGTLAQVTVLKVEGPDRALVEYEAPELLDRGKEEEGIQTFSARFVHVNLLVTGIETAGLKEDDIIHLDRTFVVAKVQNDEKNNPVYVASPSPAETDKLFAVIIPLKKPVP